MVSIIVFVIIVVMMMLIIDVDDFSLCLSMIFMFLVQKYRILLIQDPCLAQRSSNPLCKIWVAIK